MNDNSKMAFALIGGAILGAAIGILLAPAKGDETRRKVADAARKAAEKLKDNLKSAVDCKKTFSEEEAGV